MKTFFTTILTGLSLCLVGLSAFGLIAGDLNLAESFLVLVLAIFSIGFAIFTTESDQ